MPDAWRSEFVRFVERGDCEDALLVLRALETDVRVCGRKHPLGFVLYDLGESSVGARRLHIWPSAQRFTQHVDSQIHDHVFDLQSRCAVGIITDYWYDVQVAPSGQYNMYEVAYEGGASTMVRQAEQYAAEETRRVTYAAGQTYTLPSGTFHRSEVPEATMCVTFLLTRPARRVPGPRVLSTIASSNTTYDRAAVNREDSARLLEKAACVLRRQLTK